MTRAHQTRAQNAHCDIIDFDDALLRALDPEVRTNVLAEAGLLVRAFLAADDHDEVETMAHALSCGARDREMERKHARRLAAALRHLARTGV